jgi:hypothetical protein
MSKILDMAGHRNFTPEELVALPLFVPLVVTFDPQSGQLMPIPTPLSAEKDADIWREETGLWYVRITLAGRDYKVQYMPQVSVQPPQQPS